MFRANRRRYLRVNHSPYYNGAQPGSRIFQPVQQHGGPGWGNIQNGYPAHQYAPHMAYMPQPFHEFFPYQASPTIDHGQSPNSFDHILGNPLQPKPKGTEGPSSYSVANPYPYFHPYPKQNMLKRPPSGVQSILNSFKTQDGTIDFHKMMNTAGQMVNAVSQASALVKGLGGLFKV